MSLSARHAVRMTFRRSFLGYLDGFFLWDIPLFIYILYARGYLIDDRF